MLKAKVKYLLAKGVGVSTSLRTISTLSPLKLLGVGPKPLQEESSSKSGIRNICHTECRHGHLYSLDHGLCASKFSPVRARSSFINLYLLTNIAIGIEHTR